MAAPCDQPTSPPTLEPPETAPLAWLAETVAPYRLPTRPPMVLPGEVTVPVAVLPDTRPPFTPPTSPPATLRPDTAPVAWLFVTLPNPL